MEQYQNNPATEYIYDTMFSYDFESDDFPGREDMESMDSVSTFREYLLAHARRCGYSKDASDQDALVAFVADLCSESDIRLGSGTKGMIDRWLTNDLPSSTKSGRENVYRLCFALKMNAHQAGEFFLKAYLERPYNYKDIQEAVYFFCLNNHLTYHDALRILDSVEKCEVVPNDDADSNTELIGVRLSEIRSESELLRYLTENRSGFGVQNQSATNRIRELVNICREIAPREFAVSNLDSTEITVKNIDELLTVIYGYNARARKDDKLVYAKSISKSGFPSLIRRNWPQREQFQQILDKNSASYDVIRRALIMLSFYDFFAHAIVAEKEAESKRRKTGRVENVPIVAEGLFDEFVTEINTTLSACGYVQLYWRNPFDWMIGYCAMSPDPLGTLRNLIYEYYLCDPTVTDQGKKKTVLQE